MTVWIRQASATRDPSTVALQAMACQALGAMSARSSGGSGNNPLPSALAT
jgi:hypothetical protein